jgi:hypothetical protein
MKKSISILLFAFALYSSNLCAQVPVMNPITGPSVVCSSPTGPMTFSTSASNSPTSYTWSVVSPGGVVMGSPGNSVTTISFPYSAGTRTVYCYATNGFGASSTVSFVVTVFETPMVTFSGSTTICSGSSTFLQATSTIIMASPTINYTWQPNFGLNVYNQGNVVCTLTASTIYTVTATKGMCSNANTLQLTVLPVPTLNVVSGPTFMCQGGTTTLTASGASTISWNGGITNGVGFTPMNTFNYLCTGTNPNGCYALALKTISVNPIPNVNIGPYNSTVCAGSNVILTANGATSYTWTGGVINGVPFTPTASGNYSVVGSSFGCPGSSTATAFIGIVQNPTISVSVTPSLTICEGDTAILLLSGNGSTFQVNGVGTSTAVQVNPMVNTTYTISTGNPGACSTNTLVSVNVHTCDVGVREQTKNTVVIGIYPNPNSGSFVIRSSVKQNVTIVNAIGQKIDRARY